MKNTFLFSICMLFSSWFGKAQTQESFWQNFQKVYNADDYVAIYQSYDDAFKAEMSLADHITFFKDNIKAAAGNMLKAELVSKDEAISKYIIHFQKIQLSVDVMFSKQQKVMGWMWLPYKEKDTIAVQHNNPLESNLDNVIDSVSSAYLKANPKAQLSIVVVKPDAQFYYSYAAKNNTLADLNSVYEIGSITKTYTGWLVAQAAIEGKLNIKDDVRKYLKGKFPNLEYKGQPILIAHLLNHTSGLPRLPKNFNKYVINDDNPYQHFDNAAMLESLKNDKLSSKPGTKSEYSNYGFGVLTYILEQVYQLSYEQILHQKLHSILSLDTLVLTSNDKLLQGHNANGKPVKPWDFVTIAGAGAIKTSPNNLGAFLKTNIENSIPSIVRSHEVIDPKLLPASAYAWQAVTLNDQKELMYWHNGATAGFSSFYCFLKDKKVGVIVLSNVSSIVDSEGAAIIKQLWLDK